MTRACSHRRTKRAAADPRPLDRTKRRRYTLVVYNAYISINLNSMSKRINIVLPTATIQTIDRFAKKGLRSKFIKTAVEHYVESRSREALRAQLERAAVRDRDLDRQIADEWFAVDQEAWQELDAERPKRSSRSAAKSTLRRSTRS